MNPLEYKSPSFMSNSQSADAMSKGWKVYWIIVTATVTNYLIMVLWSLPLVSEMAGGDVPCPFSDADDPDADFHGATADPASVDEAWAVWRREVAFSDAFIATATDLEVTGIEKWRGPMSLRWVLIHMIEEYAQHVGHADLLRERIDGHVTADPLDEV